MIKNFQPTGNCPIRDILSRLGNKWSLLVLVTLNANGTMRFNQIHKTIDDISQRMLSVTLRTLETDGLIGRHVYAEVPPRVEYYLTDRGRSLIPHIGGLGFGVYAGYTSEQGKFHKNDFPLIFKMFSA